MAIAFFEVKMRNIFIDCGYYDGRSIARFKKMKEFSSKKFEIFAFEASELIRNYSNIKKHNVDLIKAAVWVEDGLVDFFESARRRGQANSVFKNPNASRREKSRRVKSIDFSKWIKDNFSKEDFIVLKMDIEGAEYQVLNKMLKDKTLEFIDIAFIEYHYERISDIGADKFRKLRKEMSEKTSVDFRKAIEW